jgi:hypothetical protein
MNALHLTKPKIVKAIKPITLLFFLFFASLSYAAVTPEPVKPVFDLTTIKVKDFEKLTGKKLSFFQKVKFKILQKVLRKVKGGELTDKQKQQARASMILGIASFVLLLLSSVAFIGIAGILCIPAAILAVILGAKSLKGNSNTQGIVGVVTGGVTLALIVLALILVVLFLSSFSFE